MVELREEKEVLVLKVGNKVTTLDDEDVNDDLTDKEQSNSLFSVLYFCQSLVGVTTVMLM